MRNTLLAVSCALAVAACGTSSGKTDDEIGLATHSSANPLPARAGTVLADTCVLDPWQLQTLEAPETKKVIFEVVLLCLVPRVDGTVGPRDPSAAAELAASVATLHYLGYRVNFGVSFTDESGERFDGTQTQEFISDPAWRAQFEATLVTAAEPADGVEIDIEKIPATARAAISALIGEVSPLIRPTKHLNVWVPPSITDPSDLPDGDAFDLDVLGPLSDRLRVMTLDYSDGGPPGPTTDPGWAVDAANLALSHSANIDIAYPLYGIDFGPSGERLSSWTEAMGQAATWHADVQRSATNTPYIHYVNEDGEVHDLWFDDATSTADALGAWDYGTLPANVGVFYWGLGNEDPLLFTELAARHP